MVFTMLCFYVKTCVVLSYTAFVFVAPHNHFTFQILDNDSRGHGPSLGDATPKGSTKPITQTPILFSQWLKYIAKEGNYKKFISMLKELIVNISHLGDLEQMLG